MPQRDHLLCRQCTNGHDRVTIVAMHTGQTMLFSYGHIGSSHRADVQHPGGRNASFYHPMNLQECCSARRSPMLRG
jgi:hypothetical protein